MQYNSLIKKWTIGSGNDGQPDGEGVDAAGEVLMVHAKVNNQPYGQVFLQLMVLLAAGETESCKWNAKQVYK